MSMVMIYKSSYLVLVRICSSNSRTATRLKKLLTFLNHSARTASSESRFNRCTVQPAGDPLCKVKCSRVVSYILYPVRLPNIPTEPNAVR